VRGASAGAGNISYHAAAAAACRCSFLRVGGTAAASAGTEKRHVKEGQAHSNHALRLLVGLPSTYLMGLVKYGDGWNQLLIPYLDWAEGNPTIVICVGMAHVVSASTSDSAMVFWFCIYCSC
jgi:hypothetical protein